MQHWRWRAKLEMPGDASNYWQYLLLLYKETRDYPHGVLIARSP
jgi:hypothetical protein